MSTADVPAQWRPTGTGAGRPRALESRHWCLSPGEPGLPGGPRPNWPQTRTPLRLGLRGPSLVLPPGRWGGNRRPLGSRPAGKTEVTLGHSRKGLSRPSPAGEPHALWRLHAGTGRELLLSVIGHFHWQQGPAGSLEQSEPLKNTLKGLDHSMRFGDSISGLRVPGCAREELRFEARACHPSLWNPMGCGLKALAPPCPLPRLPGVCGSSSPASQVTNHSSSQVCAWLCYHIWCSHQPGLGGTGF